MKKTTHIILISILFIAAMLPSEASGMTQILGIRHWTAPDHTRVVIDSSEKSTFETSEKGLKICIDINEALFPKSIPHRYILSDSAIRTIFLIPLTKKRVRVEITLSEERKAKIFTLGKILNKPHRIVVDVAIPEIEEKQSEERKRIKIFKKKRVVVIDPGHGGEDPGAVGPHKTLEKDIVLKIGRELQNILSKEGYDAFLTRNGDYYISFKQRMAVAREYGADLFLSIHTDSFKSRRAKGSSVYTLSLKGASSEAARLLAESENLSDIIGGTANGQNNSDSTPITLNMLQTETINQSKALGMATLKHLKHVIKPRISTVQEAPFRILKLPDIASILIEVAYISNPREEGLLLRTDYQRKIAVAIASAIGDFLPTTQSVTTVAQNAVSSHSPVSTTSPPVSQESPVKADTKKPEQQVKALAKKTLHPAPGETTSVQAPSSANGSQATKEQDPAKRIILYRVKRGDHLEKIARRYHTTVRSIMRLNKLKSKNRILVGQQLKVYSPQFIHVVKRGDNLESIAKRYKTSVEALMEINKIRSKNRIYIKQKLKLPQSR